MLKIGSIRWKGRCSKHPGYRPEVDGKGGIRGGCVRCETLLAIYTHHFELVRLIREFGTRPGTPMRKQNEDEQRQLSLLDPS